MIETLVHRVEVLCKILQKKRKEIKIETFNETLKNKMRKGVVRGELETIK